MFSLLFSIICSASQIIGLVSNFIMGRQVKEEVTNGNLLKEDYIKMQCFYRKLMIICGSFSLIVYIIMFFVGLIKIWVIFVHIIVVAIALIMNTLNIASVKKN